MRGKRLNQPIRRQSRRITPADAGKTCGFRSTLIYHTDHPRGCGENITPLNLTYPCTGSPPRMRGKLSHSATALFGARITPADAGKTARASRDRQTKRDHPRGCGENFFACRNDGFARGSPPRMRGKLAVRPLGRHQERITPADAGKTADKMAAKEFEAGSPPRMRGKREKNRGAVYGIRITPADAGKTPETVMKWWMDKDHPRGCGENINWDCCQTNGAGSPPRMRGKPLCFVLFEVVNGITPADAGKTHFRSWRRRVCRDHPRGCGENAVRR